MNTGQQFALYSNIDFLLFIARVHGTIEFAHFNVDRVNQQKS
jgi:hypothetical protein